MTRDNNTAANGTGDEDSIADVVGGGEYDWTPGERGLLLSGFFYLYVITQIPGKSTRLTLFPLSFAQGLNLLYIGTGQA